jgi:hypothetical protein
MAKGATHGCVVSNGLPKDEWEISGKLEIKEKVVGPEGLHLGLPGLDPSGDTHFVRTVQKNHRSHSLTSMVFL